MKVILQNMKAVNAIYKHQEFEKSQAFEFVNIDEFASKKLASHMAESDTKSESYVDSASYLIKMLAFAINGYFVEHKQGALPSRHALIARALLDFEGQHLERALSSYKRVMENQTTLTDFEALLDETSPYKKYINPTNEVCDSNIFKSLISELTFLNNLELNGYAKPKECSYKQETLALTEPFFTNSEPKNAQLMNKSGALFNAVIYWDKGEVRYTV